MSFLNSVDLPEKDELEETAPEVLESDSTLAPQTAPIGSMLVISPLVPSKVVSRFDSQGHRSPARGGNKLFPDYLISEPVIS